MSEDKTILKLWMNFPYLYSALASESSTQPWSTSPTLPTLSPQRFLTVLKNILKPFLTPRLKPRVCSISHLQHFCSSLPSHNCPTFTPYPKSHLLFKCFRLSQPLSSPVTLLMLDYIPQILKVFSVPGRVLDAGDVAMIKTGKW